MTKLRMYILHAFFLIEKLIAVYGRRYILSMKYNRVTTGSVYSYRNSKKGRDRYTIARRIRNSSLVWCRYFLEGYGYKRGITEARWFSSYKDYVKQYRIYEI